MKKIFDLNSEKGYYNLITLFICFGIVVLTAIVLCATYVVKAVKQDTMLKKINIEQEYNDIYFSDKILPNISVSGNDIGKMTKEEAKEFLLQSVSNNITAKILLMFDISFSLIIYILIPSFAFINPYNNSIFCPYKK